MPLEFWQATKFGKQIRDLFFRSNLGSKSSDLHDTLSETWVFDAYMNMWKYTLEAFGILKYKKNDNEDVAKLWFLSLVQKNPTKWCKPRRLAANRSSGSQC